MQAKNWLIQAQLQLIQVDKRINLQLIRARKVIIAGKRIYKCKLL